MKQIKILLIIIISFFKANSQTFESNYLSEDFLLYKGVYFKIKDEANLGFSHAFYNDLKYCQSTFDKNVIYPDKKNNSNTVKDSLIGRTFQVEDIIDKNGNPFSNSGSVLDKPILVLKDTKSKQIIYFKYDKKNEFNFPFNTSEITYDEKSICLKIEKKVDDFTGYIKINSPISSKYRISPMIIYKEISKTKTIYYLSLKTTGSTLNVNGSGATVLFEDGTKWAKSIKIDVNADSKGYEYSTFITLSQADLITFSTKKIKKYRLYIYDEIINASDAEKFKIFVKCIMETK